MGEIEGYIRIPENLEIKRNFTGDKIILVPNQEVGTTWLIFDDELQNNKFGGPIYKIVMKKDSAIIQTESRKGCIRVNY